MGTTSGQQTDSVDKKSIEKGNIDLEILEADVLLNAASYSFFQLMRVLNCLADQRLCTSKQNSAKQTIRVRPALSLSLPRSEVVSATKILDREENFSYYQVEVNFLGLYGTSSPLPNFYTEDLVAAGQEDHLEIRTFLDLFHQQSYRLHYESLKKYQAVFELADNPKESHFLSLLWSLIGLRSEKQRDSLPAPHLFLRYVNIFNKAQRSSTGLRALLTDFFPDTPLVIEECVPRRVTVPRDQRLVLGKLENKLGGVQSSGALGDCALLGDVVWDCTSKIRIEIGPLTRERFERLMNEENEWAILVSLLGYYIKTPLLCDLTFSIQKEDTGTCTLGEVQWGRLGADTWIYSQEENAKLNLLYSTQYLQ